MKKLILILTTAFVTACASPISKEQSRIEKTEVIQAESLSKNQIYDKSRQWFSEYFVSGESVVDYENRDTGSIIGKGVATTGSDPFGVLDYQIKYQLRVDTKDGRFKVTAKVLKYLSAGGTTPPVENSYIDQNQYDKAQAALNQVIADIESYVNSTEQVSSDW